MSANGSATTQQTSEITEQGKGKGKATDQPLSHDVMDEDDEDEDEEFDEAEEQPEEEDEDNLEEIDTSNILPPTRGNRSTRGKQINWAEAEQKLKEAGDDHEEDEDEDDDEDFEEVAEDEEMRD